ncbi:MAG: aspartyl protease [Nostoc sp. S4]|nr:aspartyl protease [Nostoc sp. S4]
MIQREFDELGQLFFEIELIAVNGEIFPVNALLDTGSTEWLAINEQDLSAFEWPRVETRNVVSAMGETTFNTYLGKIRLDAQEYTIEVVAGFDLREVILGLPWLETRRLVVDRQQRILTLG